MAWLCEVIRVLGFLCLILPSWEGVPIHTVQPGLPPNISFQRPRRGKGSGQYAVYKSASLWGHWLCLAVSEAEKRGLY